MSELKSNYNITDSMKDIDKTTQRFLDLVSTIELPTVEQHKKLIEKERIDIIKQFNKLNKFDKYHSYRFIAQKISELKKQPKYIQIVDELQDLKVDLVNKIDFKDAQKFVRLELQNAKYDVKSSIKHKQLLIKERLLLRKKRTQTHNREEKRKINEIIEKYTEEINKIQEKRKDLIIEVENKKKELKYTELKHYSCTGMLFREISKEDYDSVSDTRIKGEKGTSKGSIIKQNNKYYKLMLGNIKLNVKSFVPEEFSKVYGNNKRVFYYEDNDNFNKLVRILKTDTPFKKYMDR